MITVLDCNTDTWWHDIPAADRMILHDWIVRVGPGQVGLVTTVELVNEGVIRVTHLADERGMPTLDPKAIALTPDRTDVMRVVRDYTITEPPPDAWP